MATRRTAPAWPQGNSGDFKIYFLDVGKTMYGDCIVCVLNGRTIMIDGGHQSDFRGQTGYQSIPEQLREIFGLGDSDAVPIDLLICTHVHADHIGCLPELVSTRTIKVKNALLADPKIGFGHAGQDGSDAVDSLSPLSAREKSLVAALLEEPQDGAMSDAELQEFISDAATLEPRYSQMIAGLKSIAPIIYTGQDVSDLENEFADFGLKILGPTKPHLLLCGEAIARTMQGQATAIAEAESGDAPQDLMALYRGLVAPQTAGSDTGEDYQRNPDGGGKNDTSIVMRLSVGGKNVLLTGDMQFAVPEVQGLDQSMADLFAAVNEGVAYDLIKLPHHGSFNGYGDEQEKQWGAVKRLTMCGGLNDPSHPDPKTLSRLADLLQQEPDLEWARTDHNGLVTATLGDEVTLATRRGDLNDPNPNPRTTGTSGRPRRPRSPRGDGGPRGTCAEGVSDAPEDERVEVVLRLPQWGGAVDLHVAVSPGSASQPAIHLASEGHAPALGPKAPPPPPRPLPKPSDAPPVRFAAGRRLPPLLFVTCQAGLERNLGTADAGRVRQTLQATGMPVVDLPLDSDVARAAAAVAKQLSPEVAGIVIVGGYDVVPAQRLDVLDPSLRAAVAVHKDQDQFIVWSDDVYGDLDSDTMPEYPVSRIPDCRLAEMAFTCLSAGAPKGKFTRFGHRNVARPFAAEVYGQIVGTEPLNVCEPAGPRDLAPASQDAVSLYFMLHGSDADATQFWGEDATGEIPAYHITGVPSLCNGVVFSGCCWGALSVSHKAADMAPGQNPGPRSPESSIALSFLKNGANAFIGCTGTHYSPVAPLANCFGQPLHDSFWQRLKSGSPPAKALWEAKMEYLRNMPHGQNNQNALAVEMKVLREFTCLGLGW